MPKYSVLSTKKLYTPLIEKMKESGITIIEQEFIAIEPYSTPGKKEEVVQWWNDNTKAFVFTSAHAVNAVQQLIGNTVDLEARARIVFCLSGKTKEAVMASFHPVTIVATAPAAAELAQEIIAKKNVTEVVFFCGNKRRDELPDRLREQHIIVHEVEVYETVEKPVPVNPDLDGILFFSPSAVSSFFSENQLNEKVVCFAIGPTTAAAIATHTPNEMITSTAPDQPTLLQAVTNYFINKVNP